MKLLLNIANACFWPIVFMAIAQLLYLLRKENIKTGIEIILLLSFSMVWRLHFDTSRRYFIALIIPLLLLGAAASVKIVFHILKLKRYPAWCRMTLSTVIWCAPIVACIGKDIRCNIYQDSIMRIAEHAASDAKSCRNAIILDYTRTNILRLRYYSKLDVLDAGRGESDGADFAQATAQKLKNFSQIYDAVYVVLPTPRQKIHDDKSGLGLKKLFQTPTNRHKKKYLTLYKFIAPRTTLTGHDFVAETILFDEHHKAVPAPMASSIADKMIATPSARLPERWQLNLSDSAKKANGTIELCRRDSGALLHMKSIDKISVFYDQLFSYGSKRLLMISCNTIKPSMFSIQLYEYDKNKKYLGYCVIDHIKTHESSCAERLLFLLPPRSCSAAKYFRISLALKYGDVLFRGIKIVGP